MKTVKHTFTITLALFALDAFAQEKMEFSVFLSKVRAQNIELKAEGAKLEATSAKSVGLGVPPPMIGISRMQSEGERDPAYGFEVSQTIPFPSKLTSDLAARKYATDAQKESLLALKGEILAKAKISYIALWTAQQRIDLLLEKKAAIKNHIRLSRSTVRSDSFASVHLLKVESDLDMLETEIIAAEQMVAEKQAEIAGMLNADPMQFKIIAVEPPLSEIPKNVAAAQSHQIQMTLLNIEGLRARESEAKAAWYPDFNVRYKQVEPSGMSPRSNEVMVGVTLPFVFFWQPDAAAKTAGAERMQAEFELAKQKQAIQSEKAILLSKLESQKKQLDLINKKLIPRAEKRMKIIHNLAPRDMETLQDHREAMEAFPDLKLKALDLRIEYEQAVSTLEKYLPGNER